MIVQFSDLKQYQQAVTMVDGCFDPIHRGHIEYFKAAKDLGYPVLCNVADDIYLTTKHPPLLPELQRADVIDALNAITFTHLNQRSTATVLRELRPKYYAKGKDWDGRLPAAELEACRELGIEIVYLDTVLDSSTRLLRDRYLSQQVEQFERYVFNQQPVPPARYDTQYFTSEWRPEGNRYTIEARRTVEGRNPEIIRDVFTPERVLDAGCGPGMLMFFLHELGVASDGIDFSPHSKQLAPPEVREQITIGPLTRQLYPDNTFDLVICREVLEHMSVLEVRQTVRNLCQMSSRYIYVTTRYHQNPSGLLSVTDEPEVDPTHITLLTKDFLRVLFILEGFRSRPDLEARMDWLNKGRVLVLEKNTAVGA